MTQIPDRASLDVRSWFLSEIWIVDLSSALVGLLMSLSKLFLFSSEAHLNSSAKLLLELYCIKVIMHAAFFTICAKLTLAFTLLFPDVVVILDSSKNIGGSMDLAKKRHGSADCHTPIHPPP